MLGDPSHAEKLPDPAVPLVLAHPSLGGSLRSEGANLPFFRDHSQPHSFLHPPGYPSSYLGWDQPTSSFRDATAAKLCASPR